MKKTIPLIAAAVYLTSATADSAIVVDWGGKYSPSSSPSLNDGGTTLVDQSGNRMTWKYSYDVARNPTTNYTAPSGKSGTFYGAFQTIASEPSATNIDFSRDRVSSGSSDMIEFWGSSTGRMGAGNTMTLFFFFKKEDFLNGGDEGILSFHQDSYFQVNNTQSANSASLHMAVYDGVNWYLSIKVDRTDSSYHFLGNPGTASWAIWDPTGTPLNAAPDAESYTIPGSSITNIQAVGFYFEGGRTDNGPRFGLPGFNVDLVVTPIPELSTMAMLSIVAGGFALLARRRQRRRGRTPLRAGQGSPGISHFVSSQ